jgi:Beta-propeller repeat/Domain of unknown function (DUF5122) beta-propeller
VLNPTTCRRATGATGEILLQEKRRTTRSSGRDQILWRRKGGCGGVAKAVLLCLGLAGAYPATAQELDWAKRVGGVQGNDVETDSAGNTYMAGLFEGTTTFGAGEANETTLTSAGDFEILVAKHDPSGALLWAKRAGGIGLDWGFALAIDGAGNSYVTGRFRNSATFGPGDPNETLMTVIGSDDIFVAKYNSSGALVWARRAGGSSTDEGRGIAVDSAGNSYVSGFFAGSATFGLGQLNATTLTSAGSLDIFIAKYDPNGEPVWAKRAGGSSSDDAFEIATDGAGNSYATGRFLGTATFGAGEANETMLTSAGSNDGFVARYDSNGALIWARRAGGASSDDAFGIAADGAGNSYVTGQFSSTATFGGGETNQTTLTSAGGFDIFVARYNPNGALVWATSAGGTGDDTSLAIATDGSGNSYLTGFLQGMATFGGGESGETTITAAGERDIPIAKYDSIGALVWATSAGGAGHDAGSGIVVDNAGNSHVTGFFQVSATFGAGEASETTITGTAFSDDFLGKFSGGETELTLTAAQDSFLRSGNPDRNEGANPGLRLQASGNNRAVVAFDPDAIDGFGSVTTATLVLTISENAANWGQSNDRTVDAHPLAVDFAEGNGQNAGVPAAQSTRGNGPGVTWNCAVDAEIANQQTDCGSTWNGGAFGPPSAAPVLHVNGLSGEVSWNVTDDVLAGASAWLIKKTVESQPGRVSYFSREGADDAGAPDLAPRLILEK